MEGKMEEGARRRGVGRWKEGLKRHREEVKWEDDEAAEEGRGDWMVIKLSTESHFPIRMTCKGY